ncbi:hypothetical protein [Thermus scotoductus]|uniref:hypothetical protein n=1 Tax=Thermus scotoductus TaxID=37636 RepID=UPI0020A5AD3F|nr:hypothetical protein [Thermus scotoductus]
MDLETWSRGFHRVVRWVKLQTNTRGRARSIALACRYGVKVFLGPDGAFGSNPEKPRTLVRGVVTECEANLQAALEDWLLFLISRGEAPPPLGEVRIDLPHGEAA